ncbi:uncharacterized protein B0H18DRAFT_289733 [Fomitopsis serialis]|uniref:uncharacterized protein n=1 Tax=Fomitopsis serialis TaxID=139415 RepID=UPI002007EFF5|nr:uncharacterized protein B0H18DRAFT_289733 [Neoantrodia serialis]KAH9911877.1 hypothetical protein B0H18DRAFT_289733 [Neoantrodia serialis]
MTSRTCASVPDGPSLVRRRLFVAFTPFYVYLYTAPCILVLCVPSVLLVTSHLRIVGLFVHGSVSASSVATRQSSFLTRHIRMWLYILEAPPFGVLCSFADRCRRRAVFSFLPLPVRPEASVDSGITQHLRLCPALFLSLRLVCISARCHVVLTLFALAGGHPRSSTHPLRFLTLSARPSRSRSPLGWTLGPWICYHSPLVTLSRRLRLRTTQDTLCGLSALYIARLVG